MKKIIVLLALLSVTLGLNATVTKEDIYNANTEQFESLKKELATLNKTQSEKLKKVFLKKQFNEAFKKILSNKEIMNNAKYAVIKDGKIVKLSNEEDGGILFWHEHSSAVTNPPGENVCLIENPTWENTNLDSPCGVIKYQMLPDSPYAQVTNFEAPIVFFLRDYSADFLQTYVFDFVNDDDVSDTYVLSNLEYFSIHHYFDMEPNPERQTQFMNHQVVTDIVTSAGYINYDSEMQRNFIVKPYGPLLSTENLAFVNENYADTAFTGPNSQPLISLKTGRYPYFLVNYYQVSENWEDGFMIILRWFYLNVQNEYLDGVGISDNNKTPAANITWNNRQIIIDLEESVNPTTVNYELYDISGKLLQKKRLSSHQTTLNMPANVSSGAYIVRLNGKNLSLSKKIVFKK